MLLRRPLSPKRTKTGYRVEITFLDAAPPNQLRGLDEHAYLVHVNKAFEAVMQLVFDGLGASWDEVFRVRDFAMEWSRPNPYLYVTEIDFSLHGLDEATAKLAMNIRSQDSSVEIAHGLCTLSLLQSKPDGNGRVSALKKLRDAFLLSEETAQ